MPIPAEGYPATAAVSPRVQVVETTGSTNADLVAAVTGEPEAWPHLAVLLTEDQREGRGRMDRSWVTPPGTALAASVVVRVLGLPMAARGWIPLLAGAAMTGAIRGQLRGSEYTAELKWPNDVLVDGRKICGILAEAVSGDTGAVVIGAGVNTRMAEIDLPVTTAVSFAALGRECDDDLLLADFLLALDDSLRSLIAAHGDAESSGARREVLAVCATIGSDVAVALPDGGRLEGRADRLDPDGRLVVTHAAGETALSAGDVVHLR